MSKNLVNEVQNCFNNNLDLKNFEQIINQIEATEHEKNSAIRLIKTWALWKKDNKYINDFEISLRDFLIIIKSPIKIWGYTVTAFGKSIGLHENAEEKWVLQAYPDWIISNFALKSAVAEEIPCKKEGNCILSTNAFVRKLTRFSRFKSEEQKLCVMGALRAPAGSSVLISMSTGGGKSLVTQTVAFQEQGLTIVIVPTVSLMIDQAQNAREILVGHEDEIEIYNANSDFGKIKRGLLTKKIKLLFLSPEALIKNQGLRDVISLLNREGWLKNLIVDEAHIIFEWGDAFRLDFQCVDVLRRNLYESNKQLRTFLLSATFNQKNAKLLKQFYSVDENWIELRCDSLRREIRYNFIKAKSFFEKEEKIMKLISILPHPMIVYVDRPSEAKRIQVLLQEKGIHNTNIFTGETTAGEREHLIKKWKNNDFSIMIATCAFGVGVDKKDVRTVLHLYMPDNINKYYQEAGRGGRDGKSSLSVILYTSDDETGAFSFIRKKVLTTQKIIGRWFSMLNGETSKRHGDGTATLDTSIKPTYAEQDDCVTITNTRDIDWNVYVLLFLKRHNLIDIKSISYLNDNYHMLVKIQDRRLFNNNQNTYELVEQHRESEWLDTEKAYKDMKKFLAQCGQQCVSEALLQEYSLIPYEYCSGCNSHPTDAIKSSFNGLPLVGRIRMLDNQSDNFLINESVLIVRAQNFDIFEQRLMNKGIKTLILSKDRELLFTDCQDSGFVCFTLDEFKQLLDGKDYYLSKTIAIECPEEEMQIINVIQMIHGLINKFKVKVILLIKDNYFIGKFNKRLYELIEASYIEDYMFN